MDKEEIKEMFSKDNVKEMIEYIEKLILESNQIIEEVR